MTAMRVDLSDRRATGRPDYVLIVSVLVLSAIGLLMVFSASAPRLEAEGFSRTSLVIRQSVFVIGGAGVFVATAAASDRSWRLSTPYIFAITVFLLLVVLSPVGVERNGAQRWIPLKVMDLQPSEFAKPAMIMMLAVMLSPADETGISWTRIGRALGLMAVPSVLIFMEPDLGTMLVFTFVAVVMLFTAGTTLRQLVTMLVTGLVVLVMAFQLNLLKEYQLDRLTGFLNSDEHSLTTNYNQNQSQIAIGSGGLFGKGIFNGSQTNLAFVPSQTTDFVFTAVGEQLGFVGSILVLGLYLLVVWRLLIIGVAARDRFGMLVATGVAAMFGFHVFVNIGMAVGLLPVTGLPLPLMSSGGSFYLTVAFSLGVCHAIWTRRSPVPGERRLMG
ncbi:MAG: rod shape-determining protein RodA [Actinobacteria bacterium]|nr:rod shape-determining protein RodA [Actinomycetota bacterium]